MRRWRSLTTYDRRVAAIFVAAAAVVFVAAAAGRAADDVDCARRCRAQRSTVLRLAIANIHRPGALTPSVMLSLGLGLALLVTVIEIDGNLHREFADSAAGQGAIVLLPRYPGRQMPAASTPSCARRRRGSTVERVPMLRGRIVAANGIPAEDLKPAAGSRWVLHGDRGITFADRRPGRLAPRRRPVVERRTIPGRRWCRSRTRSAHDLNLKIGDTVTVNVLGRNITARIANLRAVDWESLGINFVLVFSPGAFDGAPHSDIATLTFADGGTAGARKPR